MRTRSWWPRYNEQEHAHGATLHSYPHNHEAFIENRVQVLGHRSRERTMAGRLATIAVPVGVAASPDPTILPVGLARQRLRGALSWRR
jgi:hypothetical protein